MQRLYRISVLITFLVVGCQKASPPGPAVVAPPDAGPSTANKDSPAVPAAVPGDSTSSVGVNGKAYEGLGSDIAATSKQQKYDAVLLEALNLVARGQNVEALAALENTAGLGATQEIQDQIERIRSRLGQQSAAKRTVADIRAILADGDPKQAARLAQLALQQYGDTDVAADLASLQQQANALAATPSGDSAERRAFYQKEAEAALANNQLRSAAVAYEQLLQLAEDVGTRKRLEELRDSLARYDENRRRAAELRRDPSNLEDALAALQEASRAWDTPQVRVEMDECYQALQKQRDRLSVADFEIRGNLGAPLAGKTLAEDLLPAFKSRFDLVERNQVGKVLDELQLEGVAVADNPEGRNALARLAKVRYLVVGSITPQQGVTVHARLIDVRSGLIVQTARLSAPSLDALTPQLPGLAQVLMMSDAQKLAFEQKLAMEQAAVRPIEVREIPPPPPPAQLPTNEPPPPAIVTYSLAPPTYGGLALEDFRRLPPVLIAPPPAPPLEVVLRREDPRRGRLFQLSLELGDNLLRLGRHEEAARHFQLALTLTDNRRDVEVRIDRCRPYLPPPAAPVFIRPRLAVFNFYIDAPAGLVPAATDGWAADCFASYCANRFEVIERGQVCWYMGRLGITMKEVLGDPSARVALARALHARYFAFGALVHTASFNVTTDLVDAESGAHTATALIHVQDQNEMKLRMNELFNQLELPPAQQAQVARQSKDSEKALNDIRGLQQSSQYDKAAAAAREALRASPASVALQRLQADNERLAQQMRLEEARKQLEKHRQAELQAARLREQELLKQTAQARLIVESQAKAQGDTILRNREAVKKQAYDQLAARGREAMKRNDFLSAVQAFQSATALLPNEAGMRELAQAKAADEQAARARAAQAMQQREAEQKKERALALARADEERKKRDADEALRRKIQLERDNGEYQRLMGVAKAALAKQQYDAAAAAANAARLVKGGPELEALQRKIRDEQTRADAKKKGEPARPDSVEVKRREDRGRLLRDAQDALAAKKYADAVRLFGEVLSSQPNDPQALKGQREAQAALDAARSNAQTLRRQADYQTALQAGQAALSARQFDDAAEAANEALKQVPNDKAASALLKEIEKARLDVKAATNMEVRKRDHFNRLMKQGQAATAAKRHGEALKLYTDALQLYPADPAAQKATREAKTALDADKAPPPLNSKTEYDKAMTAGTAFEKQKMWPQALKAYREALKYSPGDARALAAQKSSEFQVHMIEGQKLAAARKFSDAAKEYEQASKLFPNDKNARDALKRAQAGKP
jgi:hypothetical protein